MRVRLENEVRGLLKTFGMMFGKRVGSFKRRAKKIIARDLAVAPELVPIFETLAQACTISSPGLPISTAGSG